MRVPGPVIVRLLAQQLWVLVLACGFCEAFADSVLQEDSITAKFAERAEQCAARVEGLRGLDCGATFTLGASYALRLFSSPPTKVRNGTS
jgi:hypothetical protein